MYGALLEYHDIIIDNNQHSTIRIIEMSVNDNGVVLNPMVTAP